MLTNNIKKRLLKTFIFYSPSYKKIILAIYFFPNKLMENYSIGKGIFMKKMKFFVLTASITSAVSATFMCCIIIFAATNYRFRFMLKLSGSLLKKTLQEPIKEPFNSAQLFVAYSKMLAKYSVTKDYAATPHHDNLLGFSIDSFSYYDLNSLIHEVFAQGIYKFSTHTKEPFIIDCGSNIGISILYFKSLYPRAKIIGFEPDKSTYELLTTNLKNNNLADVVAYQKAIHPTETTLTFYSNNNAPGYPGMNIFGMAGCTSKQEISATPLSPFITQPVDFLKIDIEGAEADLIEELDMSQKLPLIQQLVMEFHPDKNSLAKTLNILEKNNFNYVISSNAKTPFLKKYSDELLLIYAFNKGSN